MTDHPTIRHGSICKKPDVQLRLSWAGRAAEIYCKNCGRYAPAPDTRKTTK